MAVANEQIRQIISENNISSVADVYTLKIAFCAVFALLSPSLQLHNIIIVSRFTLYSVQHPSVPQEPSFPSDPPM